MVWRYSSETDYDGEVTIVTPTGNKKLDITVPFGYSCYYTNGAFYNFGRLPHYDYVLVDLNAKKEYDINNTFKDFQYYYYGYGTTYAVSTDGTNYTIYNGTKILLLKKNK